MRMMAVRQEEAGRAAKRRRGLDAGRDQNETTRTFLWNRRQRRRLGIGRVISFVKHELRRRRWQRRRDAHEGEAPAPCPASCSSSEVVVRVRYLETHRWYARRFRMAAFRGSWQNPRPVACGAGDTEAADEHGDEWRLPLGVAHGDRDARGASRLLRSTCSRNDAASPSGSTGRRRVRKRKFLVHDGSYVQVAQARGSQEAIREMLRLLHRRRRWMAAVDAAGTVDSVDVGRPSGFSFSGCVETQLALYDGRRFLCPCNVWVHPPEDDGTLVVWFSIHPTAYGRAFAILTEIAAEASASSSVQDGLPVAVTARGDTIRRLVFHGAGALGAVAHIVGVPDVSIFDRLEESVARLRSSSPDATVGIVAPCIALHPALRSCGIAAAVAREDTSSAGDAVVGRGHEGKRHDRMKLLTSVQSCCGRWLDGSAQLLPPMSHDYLCRLRAQHRRSALGIPAPLVTGACSPGCFASSPGCPVILIRGLVETRRITMLLPERWAKPFFHASVRAGGVAIGYQEFMDVERTGGAHAGKSLFPYDVVSRRSPPDGDDSLVATDFDDVKGLLWTARRGDGTGGGSSIGRFAWRRAATACDGPAVAIRCSVDVIRRGVVREGWQIRSVEGCDASDNRVRMARRGLPWEEEASVTRRRPLLGTVTSVGDGRVGTGTCDAQALWKDRAIQLTLSTSCLSVSATAHCSSRRPPFAPPSDGISKVVAVVCTPEGAGRRQPGRRCIPVHLVPKVECQSTEKFCL